MEKLKKMVKDNPEKKSERSDFLRLATKDNKGVVRGNGSHTLKIVGCENAVNKDFKTQKEVKGVNLLFEEDGERKKYFVPTLGEDGKFHYLIERFADIKEGSTVIMEYKRAKNSVKGFIDVQPEEVEDELPVINSDEDLEEESNEDKIDESEIF